MKKEKSKKWHFPKICTIVILISFFVLEIRMAYIALFPRVDGINIKEFAKNRNTTTKVLKAGRGVIYDSSGDVLAQNVTSYTVVAILSESRKDRVIDKEMTAKKISEVLDTTSESILKLLNYRVYQVELGPWGRGINIQKKEEIESLNLPGIEFIESIKRNYPNGDFASYIIGYAKNYETDEGLKIVGELGIEGLYNKELTGTNGYFKYQRDTSGYQIPDTPEERVEAIDGMDIYLTIDSNIQRFAESAIKEMDESADSEWSLVAVMNAKTGEILASATTPSFNPNILNITNYENPLVSYTFEPGSTMKTYSYMCAIEESNYNGEELFESGSIEIDGGTVKDWNTKGFGLITLDKGYEYSSNVGAVMLMRKYLTKQQLLDCYKKYGFGSKTGIELSREMAGKISFNYDLEVANATFGQGITTTPIQHLQGLSIIANNGQMITPYIVKQIVDPNSEQIVYEGKTVRSEQLVSVSTTNKMKDLMKSVVDGKDEFTTGYGYGVDGLDIIGKTGTAQIWNTSLNAYEYGSTNYIYSFAGMFPYEEPEIIIYTAMKKPKSGTTRAMKKLVRDLSSDISKYLNIVSNETSILDSYEMEIFYNKDAVNSYNVLREKDLNVIVIGNGNVVIDQYPQVKTKVIAGDLVILKTNDVNRIMPSFIDLSYKEASKLCEMLNVKCEIEGNGYVYLQSVNEGEIITNETSIKLELKEKE